MTCCVAALADDREALILIADRMVSNPVISAEPNIHKMIPIHRDWWMMVADDPSPASPVSQALMRELPNDPIPVEVMEEYLGIAVARRRDAEAAAKHIAPYGLTLPEFMKDGRERLGGRLYRRIYEEFASHQIALSLIVAGFDDTKEGHILGIEGKGSRALRVDHHSLVGRHAIGSGSPGANFIMSYKDLGPAMPVRLALYYAFEGKYFGELAYGVGTATDIVILRPGHGKPVVLGTSWVNDHLVPLCKKLEPKWIKMKQARRLNSERRLRKFARIKKRDL